MQSLEVAVGRAGRILRIFKANTRHIFLKFELSALRPNLISMRRTGENSAQTVVGGAARSRRPMRAAALPRQYFVHHLTRMVGRVLPRPTQSVPGTAR
jgi:hypothetical protein